MTVTNYTTKAQYEKIVKANITNEDIQWSLSFKIKRKARSLPVIADEDDDYDFDDSVYYGETEGEIRLWNDRTAYDDSTENAKYHSGVIYLDTWIDPLMTRGEVIEAVAEAILEDDDHYADVSEFASDDATAAEVRAYILELANEAIEAQPYKVILTQFAFRAPTDEKAGTLSFTVQIVDRSNTANVLATLTQKPIRLEY